MKSSWLVTVFVVGLASCAQRSETPTSPANAASSIMDTPVIDAGADELTPLLGDNIMVGNAIAYLSLAPGARVGGPAVVVVHDAWGLNDHVRRFADRLAMSGLTAIAVDLYGGHEATTGDEAQSFASSIDPARAIKELEAVAAFLKSSPAVSAGKRGVIGWSTGGRWALATAVAVPRINAVVIYDGQLETSARALKSLNAPLLAFFSTRPTSMSKGQVDDFTRALKKKHATIERIDVGDAFDRPPGRSPASPAAAKAWRQTLAFFAAKLGSVAPQPVVANGTWTSSFGVQGAAQLQTEQAADARTEKRGP